MSDILEERYSEPITNDFNGQMCFINKLEQDYIEFVEIWTKEYKKYYKLFKNDVNNRPNIIRLRKSILNIEKICKRNFRNNKNTDFIHINIVPEKVITKSPLTILNGKWGSGKTHFLTELLISIKKEKIKPKIIKKYIYIDSWKYLSSNNLVNDFIVELGKNLAPDSGVKWFNSKKMIKNIFNYAVVPNINKRFGLAIPKLNYDNSISTINRNITSPTLIIIDNVERLGYAAWEIIRVIQKLSISTNLIFLLSINKDKFNELCGLKDNGTEWSIDKYITMPMYKIANNYCGVLSNFFAEEYLEMLNDILNKPISNECFNLRQLENILKVNKGYEKLKNKCQVLIWFKRIWNPKIYENNSFINMIEKIINIDINEFRHICASISVFSLLIIKGDNLESINIKLIEFRDNTFGIETIDFQYRFLSSKLLELQEKINEIAKNNYLSEKCKFLINWINSKISYIKGNKNFIYLNEISKCVFSDYLEDFKNSNQPDSINVTNKINLKYIDDWNRIMINKIKGKMNI